MTDDNASLSRRVTEEDAFRLTLRDAWDWQDWGQWHNVRLIFADWLEEHDRPEAALARCEMEPTPWYLGGYGKPEKSMSRFAFLYVRAPTIYQWRERRKLSAWTSRKTNAAPLLHFAPQTLTFRGLHDRRKGLGAWWRFTWMASPRNMHSYRPDTDVHGWGFPALFHAPQQALRAVEPKPLFQEMR